MKLSLYLLLLLPTALRSLSAPNASVPELNPLLFRDLYPTYLHAGILYSHSVRPTLTLPIHSHSHDTPACFYHTLRNASLNCSSAPPEPVSLELDPFLLNNFDEAHETFRADLYAKSEWNDWRLDFSTSSSAAEGARHATESCFHLDAARAPEYTGDYFVLGDADNPFMPGTTHPAALWRPHSFEGQLSVTGPPEVESDVTRLCSGRVRHTLHASFEFRTDLDMHSYPFDSHLLQMFFFDPAKRPWMMRTKLARNRLQWTSNYFPSWDVGAVDFEVRFVFLVGRTNSTEMGGWRAKLGELVKGHNQTLSLDELEDFVRGLTEEEVLQLVAEDPPLHEVVVASFVVQRSLTYVALTQMFPLLLIYLMGGIPYFLAIDSSGTRLTIGITCVLTLTSLTGLMVTEIPRVDYLTFMHVLLIGTYFVLFFILLHIVTVAMALKRCFLVLSGSLGDDGSLLRSEVYGYLQKRLTLLDADADAEHSLDDAPSLISEFRAMPLRDWTAAQVSQYMKMHHHSACAENMVEFNINGAVLEVLDADELVSLGVENRFEAHKMIVELRGCRKFRRHQPRGETRRGRKQRWRDFWTHKRFRRWMLIYKMSLTVLDAQLMWIHPLSLVIFVLITYAATKSSGAS